MTQFTDALGNPINVGDDVAYVVVVGYSPSLIRGRILKLDPLIPHPHASKCWARESKAYKSADPTAFRLYDDDESRRFVPVIEIPKKDGDWDGTRYQRTLKPNNPTLIVITRLVRNATEA